MATVGLSSACSSSNNGHQRATFSFLAVIVRKGRTYGGFFPDLPGCVSVAPTAETIRNNLHEALTGHLELMLEDNDPIPNSETHHYKRPKPVSDGSEIVDQFWIQVLSPQTTKSPSACTLDPPCGQ